MTLLKKNNLERFVIAVLLAIVLVALYAVSGF